MSKRHFHGLAIDLGHVEIESGADGQPVLVIYERWKEHGQRRIRVRLGAAGAIEFARALHALHLDLRARVDRFLNALRGA